MRRFASFASTLVLAVTFALPSAAETSRWDWLRARVFGAPPVETNAKAAEDALARRGGTRMILQIDSGRLRPAVIETMRDDTRRALREAGIPWAGRPNVRDGSVEMRLREADVDRAKDALGVFFGRSTIDLHDMGGGVITLAPTTADFGARLRGAREQAIDVIRLRVKGLGIAPADVRADDSDRIVVLLPGVTEPARLALLTARAELTFRLVDVSMTPADALRSRPPLESEVLYDKSKEPLLVHKQVLMGGKELLESCSTRMSSWRRSSASRFWAARARSPAAFRSSRRTISPSCCAAARCRPGSWWSSSAPSSRRNKSHRHARPCAGHPRLCGSANREDVDGRDKPGHDE